MAVREHRHRAIHHIGHADGAVRPNISMITTGRVILRTLDSGLLVCETYEITKHQLGRYKRMMNILTSFSTS